jgi:hypothetical protein
MPICLPLGPDFPDVDVGLAGYVAGKVKLPKAQFTRDISAHNIAIKKYFDISQ